jgi:hypothetical protein
MGFDGQDVEWRKTWVDLSGLGAVKETRWQAPAAQPAGISRIARVGVGREGALRGSGVFFVHGGFASHEYTRNQQTNVRTYKDSKEQTDGKHYGLLV